MNTPTTPVPRGEQTHAATATGRALCGRKTRRTTNDPTLVTCGDCTAAQRADRQAAS